MKLQVQYCRGKIVFILDWINPDCIFNLLIFLLIIVHEQYNNRYYCYYCWLKILSCYLLIIEMNTMFHTPILLNYESIWKVTYIHAGFREGQVFVQVIHQPSSRTTCTAQSKDDRRNNTQHTSDKAALMVNYNLHVSFNMITDLLTI